MVSSCNSCNSEEGRKNMEKKEERIICEMKMENLEASADLLKKLLEESSSLLYDNKLNCQALYERVKDDDKNQEIEGCDILEILCNIYYQCQNRTYKWKQIEADHRLWDTIFQRYVPVMDNSLTNPSTNLFKRKYSCEEEPEVSTNKRASNENVENARRARRASITSGQSPTLFAYLVSSCEKDLEVLQDTKELTPLERQFASDLFRADKKMLCMIQFLACSLKTQVHFVKYEYAKKK